MTDKPDKPMTDDELERFRKENVERRKRLRRELKEDDGA